MTAMTAPMAPSVEVIGPTTETLPLRSAVRMNSRPMTFEKPEMASRTISRVPRLTGPDSTIRGIVRMAPTTITQASVDEAPISLELRAEQRIDTDQQMAAPSPPRMGITALSLRHRHGLFRMPLLPCASVPSACHAGRRSDHPLP
jgi:hypothetical protein